MCTWHLLSSSPYLQGELSCPSSPLAEAEVLWFRFQRILILNVKRGACDKSPSCYIVLLWQRNTTLEVKLLHTGGEKSTCFVEEPFIRARKKWVSRYFHWKYTHGILARMPFAKRRWSRWPSVMPHLKKTQMSWKDSELPTDWSVSKAP